MNDLYTIEWIADDGVYKILYLDRQLECPSGQYIGTHPWFDIVAVLQWRRIRIINTRLTNLKPWDQLSIRPLTRYEKKEHETALRYNEGKTRWSLVHFPSLEPLVRVLEFWAKKYTKDLLSLKKIISFIQLWQKHEFVQIVLKKDASLLEEYVLPVTETWRVPSDDVVSAERLDNCDQSECADLVSKKKDCLATQISWLSSKNILESIANDQSQNLKAGSEQSSEERIWSICNKLKDDLFYEDLNHTVSLKSFIWVSHQEVVQYANLLKDYTLIMTIRHDNTEAYFVVSATNEYDCLMTLYQKLQVLWIISYQNPLSSITSSISWEKNWMKPMDKKQILDSMIRHLVRLMEDEELDSESWLQHIGHLMANCMFYSYHSNNK